MLGIDSGYIDIMLTINCRPWACVPPKRICWEIRSSSPGKLLLREWCSCRVAAQKKKLSSFLSIFPLEKKLSFCNLLKYNLNICEICVECFWNKKIAWIIIKYMWKVFRNNDRSMKVIYEINNKRAFEFLE